MEHVILLLKAKEAGHGPALRVAVAVVWQVERLLLGAFWALPAVGSD